MSRIQGIYVKSEQASQLTNIRPEGDFKGIHWCCRCW